MSKHGTCGCGCENESKQCHCDETCTCGCQEGKPCTCGYECDCGCCGNQNKEIAFELCRTLIEGRDRKSTRLNSSHTLASRMPSSA